MAYSILLADDSQHAQRDGSRILSELGYEVVAVSNGSAALQQLEDRAFDLVIADTSMPGLTGLEVCQRIRERPEWTSLPVLLALAAFELYDAGEGRRVGADDVIQKPFIPSALERAVQTLLAKVGKVAAPTAGVKATEETDAADESDAATVDANEEDDHAHTAASAEEQASAVSEPLPAAPVTEPEEESTRGGAVSSPLVESPAATPEAEHSASGTDSVVAAATDEADPASAVPPARVDEETPRAPLAAAEPAPPRWEVEALEVVSEGEMAPTPEATPLAAAAADAGPVLASTSIPAPGSWLATLAELKTAVESAPPAAPPVPNPAPASEPEDVLLSAWREAMAAAPNSQAQVDLATALNAVDEVLAQYLAPMIAGEASDQIARRLRALSR